MSLSGRLLAAVQALTGTTEFQAIAPTAGGLGIDSPGVEAVRRAIGGQLQPLPTTRPRWYLSDLETAQFQADSGDLSQVGQLSRSMRRDGVIAGLLNTRTAGLVALPKRFRGNPKIVADLRADVGTRTTFDEMMPSQELAAMAADLITCGVCVGVMTPVVNRPHPVLERLDPEFLVYRWNEDRWYYRSVAGLLTITPGDGRWVLGTAGRYAPWNRSLWPSLGRAFITKEHAILARGNYSAKLANPARVAHTPLASTDEQDSDFLSQVIAWGYNTVFALPPGYEVDLLESNGRGHDVFKSETEWADNEAMVVLAGQIVTTTGGSGFANADIHRTIRADLIRETADALAHIVNTQIIPPWEIQKYGIDSLGETARVEWDTDPPKDRKTEAESLEAVGKAITTLRDALAGKPKAPPMPPGGIAGPPKPFGAPAAPGAAPGAAPDDEAAGKAPKAPAEGVAPPAEEKPEFELDVEELCNRFGIPLKGAKDKGGEQPKPDTQTAPPQDKSTA